MFGPRITTVFTSRWKALWWSASMLLFAWSVVPAADESGDASHQHKAVPADPWAKDPPTK
ncbi:MAG: hypothetical protein B7X90_13210 [Novosphingobium sp. 17-62-19]|uniref:hypothetical protein n=1 Tax=Novosphingobium sp. 17-62-19 TaxID=1970406 RepID=UPI000BC3B0E9|nr:hypothetical protein [Novosphingobium sp. 17-62-19]OYX94449.1 MAG: hypothetical protein B7Y74_06975 [Novosphingobium sp. 35-62-5]OZA17999.1 MAG: hypothetical protein B7X90_13210 [Novosphingobium sp. 17-62-19]HQS98032.1 hypothetical protein [Novosphingobium sp.]